MSEREERRYAIITRLRAPNDSVKPQPARAGPGAGTGPQPKISKGEMRMCAKRRSNPWSNATGERSHKCALPDPPKSKMGTSGSTALHRAQYANHYDGALRSGDNLRRSRTSRSWRSDQLRREPT